VLGRSKPCLFPAVIRPTILVPATEVCTMGITSPSSASKTEWKFSEDPRATRQ